MATSRPARPSQEEEQDTIMVNVDSIFVVELKVVY